MGNSGIRKIFFKGPEVESPYSSLYDMSVINIQKHEVQLIGIRGEYSIVVNTASRTPNDEEQLRMLSKMESYLKDNNIKANILVFPSNSLRNEQHTYSEIQATYSKYFGEQSNIEIMAKVEVNGKYQHPVYKFLKRHSAALYDENLCQGKNIPEDFCMFLVGKDGVPQKFYRRQQDHQQIMKDIV